MTFARKDTLKRHNLRFHSSLPVAHECLVCYRVFLDYDSLKIHRRKHAVVSTFKQKNTSLHGTAKVFVYAKIFETTDVSKIQGEISREAITVINNELNLCLRAKVMLVINVEMSRLDENGHEVEFMNYLVRAVNFSTNRYNDHRADLFAAFEEIKQKIDLFVENGSAWIMRRIVGVNLEIARCAPLNGNCGKLGVTLKSEIDKIQIDGTEPNDCFDRAIAAHFVGTECSDKIDQFIKNKIVSLVKNNCGVEVKDIGKFERENESLSLRINVLYKENEDMFPLRVSKNIHAKNTINLLLVQFFHEESGRLLRHYYMVNNLHKLIRKEYFKKDSKKHSYEKGFPCVNCFTTLSSQRLLDNHFEKCSKNSPTSISFPHDGRDISFEEHNKKFRVPFIGFLDMEAKSVIPTNPCSQCSDMSTCSHLSHIEKEQHAISYSLLITDISDKMIFSKTYHGDDCVKDLKETLWKVRNKIKQIVSKPLAMNMTPDDKHVFKNAKVCHICEESFEKNTVVETKEESIIRLNRERDFVKSSDSYENDPYEEQRLAEENPRIVRDHCHFTGKFLGAAHNLCNLNRRVSADDVVPIYCHNFSGEK